MNWDRIAGNWKQAKGKVKEQWGKLTDDDLDTVAGKRDQLVGKIQNSYGIGKDEAEKQLDEWEARQFGWTPCSSRNRSCATRARSAGACTMHTSAKSAAGST